MNTNVLARSKTILAFLVVVTLSGIGLAWTTSTSERDVQPSPEAKSIFIVRHAEKLHDGNQDPDLSDVGYARAERLVWVLRDQELDAIYVTRTSRSVHTAASVAEAMGIEPNEYPQKDTLKLLEMIKEVPEGGSVLIVAHSNTVPMIVAALGGRAMDELADDEYDRLIAIITEDGRHVRSVELRY